MSAGRVQRHPCANKTAWRFSSRVLFGHAVGNADRSTACSTAAGKSARRTFRRACCSSRTSRAAPHSSELVRRGRPRRQAVGPPPRVGGTCRTGPPRPQARRHNWANYLRNKRPHLDYPNRTVSRLADRRRRRRGCLPPPRQDLRQAAPKSILPVIARPFSLPSAIVPTMEACASWWWTTSRRSASRWRIVIPAGAVAAGIGAALLVGAAAGLYPAVRAARLAPTEALRSV